MIANPYAPVMTKASLHPNTGLLYEVCGDPIVQAAANKGFWKKILEFFLRFS